MLFEEIDVLIIFMIFGVVFWCDVDEIMLVNDRNVLFVFMVIVGFVGLF